jgi:hypothetical protein
VKLVAPLEHQPMFRHQCVRPLLQMKLGAFLDPDLGPFRRAPESREDSNFGVEPQPIVPPMPGSDHPAIEVENALQLGTVE